MASNLMERKLQILPTALLDEFCSLVSLELQRDFEALKESELSISTFSFYTSVSAVFSSKIEGEEMELDSYVKHKRFGIEFRPDYTRKIDDLYSAYQFAKSAACNEQNIALAHKMLTAHFLPESKQGKIRQGNMFVLTDEGKIEYVAASPGQVPEALKKFYADLSYLTSAELSVQEVFYFAAMLHLVYVKIHPFEDGNGRISRLLEKWFLSAKLGEKAWLIQSEKNYYLHHQTYYHNIRLIGLEYDLLDYSKSLPFLNMLADSLKLT